MDFETDSRPADCRDLIPRAGPAAEDRGVSVLGSRTIHSEKDRSDTARPGPWQIGLTDVILDCEVIGPAKDEPRRVDVHVNDEDVLHQALEEEVRGGR